ncbi:MAG: hypothetical protein JSV64_00315 [Candidatus Bathyarchaeota archaeon]|nr:MAG: hypothetical protein JSV64_00315 [Candidatus Bathyarchaeota archaeon]
MKKLSTGLLIFILSLLPLFAGLTYFLYLQVVFPQLVPHYGGTERFTLSKTQNGTYTYHISWSAYTRLHLSLQANNTVALYVNGTYVRDCTHYDLVVEQHRRALILLRSDLPVSGMFNAWQEIPLEGQFLASALLLIGLIGIGISVIIHVRKMGFLGDTAKGTLILTVVVWIFAIFEFIEMNQIVLVVLLLFGFLIPLYMIVYAYLKS